MHLLHSVSLSMTCVDYVCTRYKNTHDVIVKYTGSIHTGILLRRTCVCSCDIHTNTHIVILKCIKVVTVK
jgi:hypothetical protein